MVFTNSTAILGGSFNPPHIGHFHIAFEVYERLAPQKVQFMPCALPPHKPASNLLPFDLRVDLLRSYTNAYPFFSVTEIENERSGPSYTVDTIEYMLRKDASLAPLFIMGEDDLPMFHLWHDWERLAAITDIAVLPRLCHAEAFVGEIIHTLWNGVQRTLPDNISDAVLYKLPTGKKIIHLQQSVLEVSSTLIRSRWLAGKNIDLFVPAAAIGLLQKNRDQVRSYWQRA